MEINAGFFFFFLYSFIVFTIIFYIPGRLIVERLFADIKGKISTSFAIGIGVWALLSYLFHFIGIPSVLWIYISGCVILYIWRYKNRQITPSGGKVDKILLVIIIFGSFFGLMSVFFSGIKDSRGVWFYSINADDGMYYLALIRSLMTHFPPFEPGFSGVIVKNYHYFSNLVIADSARMFGIGEILLLFGAFPVLLSILRGFLAYSAGLSFDGKKNTARIFAFLAYFGSDIGYATSFFLLHKFSITNLQPIDRANMILVNTPRAFAEIVFLAGLILLFDFLKDKKISKLVACEIILVTTVGFKIYVGVFAVLVMTLLSIWEFIKTRDFKYILALSIPGAIALIVYIPTNANAGSLFFAPFAWPTLYFMSDALQTLQWHLREQIYWEHHNMPHILVLKMQELIIFLVTIFGVRIIGLIPFRIKNIVVKYTILFIPMVIFIFIGTMFLQEKGLYNTFNFLSMSALMLSLFTAHLISSIKLSKNQFALVFILLVLITIPRPIADLGEQIETTFGKGEQAKLISNQEILGLNYLKNNTPDDSVIIADPENKRDYYSPYIEYFGQRPTFLSNLNILDSHQQPTEDRRKTVAEIFSSSGRNHLMQKLEENNIDYIYIKLPNAKAASINYKNGDIVFKNREVMIVKQRGD